MISHPTINKEEFHHENYRSYCILRLRFCTGCLRQLCAQTANRHRNTASHNPAIR